MKGFTVYMALRDSGTHIGDWVVISGAGGGLGHLAVQYAAAMGLRVIAVGEYIIQFLHQIFLFLCLNTLLDTGEDKKEFCMKLGAEKWIDFKETSDVVAAVMEITDGLGAHAAIVAAAAVSAFAELFFHDINLIDLVSLRHTKLPPYICEGRDT